MHLLHFFQNTKEDEASYFLSNNATQPSCLLPNMFIIFYSLQFQFSQVQFQTNTNHKNMNASLNHTVSSHPVFPFPYPTTHAAQSDSKKGKRWTAEEDELLQTAVINYGPKNWREIAKFVPGRTGVQCLHRWSKILRPGLVKGPWLEDEDQLLLQWVEKYGPCKWSRCSHQIKGRSGKQCRERWYNALAPDIKKGEWTYEEDIKILTLYFEIGGKWSQMVKFFQGRSENSIKNRFYSNLRKMVNMKRKGRNEIEVPMHFNQKVKRNKTLISYDQFLRQKSLAEMRKFYYSLSVMRQRMLAMYMKKEEDDGIARPIPQRIQEPAANEQ